MYEEKSGLVLPIGATVNPPHRVASRGRHASERVKIYYRVTLDDLQIRLYISLVCPYGV